MLLAGGSGAAISAWLILSLDWWPGRISVLVSSVLVAIGAQWIMDTTEFRTSLPAKAGHYSAMATMMLNALVILGWFAALAIDVDWGSMEPTACSRFCD